MPREHLGLPVERQVPGKALRDDPGNERGRHHGAFDHPARRGGLDDRTFTCPASVLGTNGDDDAQYGGHDVESFGLGLVDLVHGALTAGTLGAVGFDHVANAWQVLGQGTDIAPGLAPGDLGRRIVIGCRRRRSDGAQITQIEAALFVENDPRLFRTRAEEHRLVSVQLAVFFLQFGFQLGHPEGHDLKRFCQIFRSVRHPRSIAQNPQEAQ